MIARMTNRTPLVAAAMSILFLLSQATALAQTSRSASSPASAPAKRTQSLAVITFKNLRPNADTDWIGAGAAETLTTKLTAVTGLLLVERSQVKEITDEQDFQKADLTDAASAVKAGKILGVARVVVGTYFNANEKLTFNVRVVDVETAQVLNAANISGKEDELNDLLLQLAEAVIKSFDKKVVVEDAKPVVKDASEGERISLTADQKKAIQNTGTRNPAAYQAYSRGYAAGSAGDAQGFVAWMSKAIEADPTFAMAYNDRGMMYLLNNRSDLALADVNAALTLESGNAMFWANRGWIYLTARQADAALKDFNKAIDVNPTYPRGYSLRGVLYFQKGSHDAAIKDFTKAISLYPHHELYYGRANCYYAKQQFAAAVNDMNQAVSLSPAYAMYYLARAQAYYGNRQYQNASADIKRCIVLGGTVPQQFINAVDSALSNGPEE